MARDNGHRAHPVRNFFYTLYSLLNAFAFVFFFYVLYAVNFPMPMLHLIAAGAIVLVGLIVGVLRPLFRRRR